MTKMCVFSRSPHLFFGKYFTWGQCRLAWRVLTLIDENYRGEPHSCQMFQKRCLPLVYTQKKKEEFPTVFQNILFISQFMNCFITARGKIIIETTVKWIPIFFNKAFVGSFFPVNLRGVNVLWQPKIDISETSLYKTLKEFTIPVIFSSRNSATDCNIVNPM